MRSSNWKIGRLAGRVAFARRFLSVLFVLFSASASVAATIGVQINGADIGGGSGGSGGTAWTFAAPTATLTGSGPYLLSGTNGLGKVTNKVSIVVAANCAVTFSNLVVRGTPSPFQIQANRTMWLTLAGTNSLDARNSGTGLTVPAGAKLVIDGRGRLDVTTTGVVYTPAIGGGTVASGCGTIIISNGTVVATGYSGGSGIGGGLSVTNGSVLIAGGDVTAIGTAYSGNTSYSGAGIGGGALGGLDSVIITGGRVRAVGGLTAPGIGTGAFCTRQVPMTIGISGGTVAAWRGAEALFDIGIGNGSTRPTVNTFTGGSVFAASSAITNSPMNAAGSPVRCVTVTGLDADSAITGISIPAAPSYGVNDIFSDAAGQIYLWLPNGTNDVSIGDFVYRGIVANTNTVAWRYAYKFPVAPSGRLPVSYAWITNKYHEVDMSTPTNVVRTTLEAHGANGLPRWQSYALGLDPKDGRSVIVCDSAQNASVSRQRIVGLNVRPPVDLGATIVYVLEVSRDQGRTWSESARGASPDFEVDLSGYTVPARYRIRVDIVVG